MFLTYTNVVRIERLQIGSFYIRKPFSRRLCKYSTLLTVFASRFAAFRGGGGVLITTEKFSKKKKKKKLY